MLELEGFLPLQITLLLLVVFLASKKLNLVLTRGDELLHFWSIWIRWSFCTNPLTYSLPNCFWRKCKAPVRSMWIRELCLRLFLVKIGIQKITAVWYKIGHLIRKSLIFKSEVNLFLRYYTINLFWGALCRFHLETKGAMMGSKACNTTFTSTQLFLFKLKWAILYHGINFRALALIVSSFTGYAVTSDW